MPGEAPEARTQARGAGPSWLRLGCLLVIGQLSILGVLVVRADSATPPAPAVGRLAGPAPDAGGAPSATKPPTSTTVPPPVPVSTTVPSATPVPTTTDPPPARSSVPSTTAGRAVIPPAVPPANIAPQPDFLQSCSGTHYDDSFACLVTTLEAIAHARSAEGLGPLTLPSNWAQLTPGEQTFVATNLERTARGLPPLAAMASALDQAAVQGADAGADPSPPRDFPSTAWGSNWAGAVGNPLEAIYFWMYDDGTGSSNIECTPSNHSGCWGHRQNVLMNLPCHRCVMGTGWAANGYKGDPSLSELLVEATGSAVSDFTWQQESPDIS
jgi:hypothetical protein